MITLACETSTLLGSVAVVKDQKLLTEKTLFRQGSHSDTLNTLIQACFSESKLSFNDIDLYASGLGPGSFTGIRISLNTIKTFSFIHNKPTLGLDSLLLLAHGSRSEATAAGLKTITTLINAYKNMLYFARFDLSLNILETPQVLRVQNLESFMQNESFVVGDGYQAYQHYYSQSIKDKMIRPTGDGELLDFPKASALGLLSQDEKYSSQKKSWADLLPIYLRASEAEENLKGIRYQPL